MRRQIAPLRPGDPRSPGCPPCAHGLCRLWARPRVLVRRHEKESMLDGPGRRTSPPPEVTEPSERAFKEAKETNDCPGCQRLEGSFHKVSRALAKTDLIGTGGPSVCWIDHKTTSFDNLYRGKEMESRRSHPKGQEIVEKSNLLMRKKHALDWFREIMENLFCENEIFRGPGPSAHPIGGARFAYADETSSIRQNRVQTESRQQITADPPVPIKSHTTSIVEDCFNPEVRLCLYMYLHACLLSCMHLHAYIHPCVHACTHAYIHVCICINVCTSTCTYA